MKRGLSLFLVPAVLLVTFLASRSALLGQSSGFPNTKTGD